MSKKVFIRTLLVFLPLLCFIPYAGTRETCKSEACVLLESQCYISSIAAVDKASMNKPFKQFVKKYIRRNREELYYTRLRSGSPFAVIDSVFNRYGLPVQLKYLAVIESDLKCNAVSRVGAAGPWQLMPRTAELLGLKVTRGRDERTHYSKSTKAAALYLRDLYGEFGDWLLVLAAYNCGPGPVHEAIRKSGSRNFWVLQYFLPAESREHVKKFIAAHYYFEGHGSETTLTRAERRNVSEIRVKGHAISVRTANYSGDGNDLLRYFYAGNTPITVEN